MFASGIWETSHQTAEMPAFDCLDTTLGKYSNATTQYEGEKCRSQEKVRTANAGFGAVSPCLENPVSGKGRAEVPEVTA
jgi:hypothetical protein